MTVVVTGAAGLLGSHLLTALLEAGHDTRGVDAVAPPAPVAAPFLCADLTELGEAIEALAGAEAVLHAAAIPRPTGRPSSVVLRTNVLAAANVAEAAVLHGLRRFVNASSFSVLGWPFNPRPLTPSYLPIDEAHPLAPQEAYALSKLLTEEIVTAATRRSDLTAISLRMPWLQTPETFAREIAARRDPRAAAANLWAYLDVRDAADAFLAALFAPVTGHVAVYLSAADSFAEAETEPLIRETFGAVELRRPLPGHSALLDTTAAGRLLGVLPRHGWRDYDRETGA